MIDCHDDRGWGWALGGMGTFVLLIVNIFRTHNLNFVFDFQYDRSDYDSRHHKTLLMDKERKKHNFIYISS